MLVGTGTQQATSLRHTSGATSALIIRYVRSQIGDDGVERLLELAGETRSPSVLEDETTWITYQEKIALFDAAASVLGDPLVATHIGGTVLEHRVGLPLKLLLKTLGSPGQVLRNVAKATPKFSTVATMAAPEVSGSRAIVTYRLHDGFEPSRYDCGYNIGLLSQVSVLFGLPAATIEHPQCQVTGADECVYEVRWRNRRRRLGRSKKRDGADDQMSALTDRYEALQSAVVDLVSDDDLEAVLGRIATRAADCVRAEAHVLAVTPTEGSELRILHEGVDENQARELALAARESRAIPDLGVLCVEIATSRRHYGHLLAVYSSDHPFFDEEQRVLETFAHHAAAALDAATALEEARAEAATSQALLTTARSFAHARSVSEMAQSLAEVLPSLAGGGQALTLLWNPEQERLRVYGIHGFEPADRDTMLGLSFSANDTPEVARLVEQRSPRRFCPDTADPFIGSMMKAFGSLEVYVVPISARGRFLGVLVVGRRRQDPPLVHESLLRTRLVGLADQVATGIEKMDLLHKLTNTVESLRTEVTERQRTEADLRVAEREMRDLFYGVPLALYRVGADGTVLDGNPALAALIGVPDVGSLIGRNSRDFYVDDRDAQRFRELISENDVVKDVESRLRRPDGSIVWIRDTARAVRTDRGDLIYFEGAIEDITEAKAVQEERERLEQQLLQAQRLEAVGGLAGGIAHDFNNLLSIITNFAEFLIEDLSEDDPRRGDAVEIRKAADRGTNLVKQLRAFSRREDVSPQVVDLGAVVLEAEPLLRTTLGDSISLELRTDAELWRANADPGQIQEILLNLAANARDAMPDGGELVIASTNDVVTDAETGGVPMTAGRYVSLSVTDTGCGMSEEVKAQVFEPFFTTKGRGAGTGLGLAMVYGLVKQAGGYVWVESAPGQGTTVTIYLPTTEEDLSGSEGESPAARTDDIGGTILLVEDEDAVRALVERILVGAGYSVVSADSAEAALGCEEAVAGKFDLLLTDVIMHGATGRDLFDRLTGLGHDFKTIFMSGYTDQIVVRDGILAEGCEFLQKPFTGEQILETVRRMLTLART